jgi:sterol desaturase/sphingolipid hydroxylase (fatty acid hydroxylase superfamily)
MLSAFNRRLREEWDREYEPAGKRSYFIILIIGIAFTYTFLELFWHIGNPGAPVGIREFISLLRGQVSYEAPALIKSIFPYVWIAVVFSCYSFRVYMIITSYFISVKKFGKARFQRDIWVYILSVAGVIIATVLLFRIIGLIFYLSGKGFHNGIYIIEHGAAAFTRFIDSNIPTLVELPYPLAVLMIFAGITLGALGGYFIHWLTHYSRVLWLTVHRPHHMPEILYPVGIPLAFNFDFVLVLPGLLFNVVFTKFFYTGPLILENSLILVFYYHFEIYNHLATHYHIAYKNKVVRFFSDLTGSGIYHYMHHTAEPGKLTVNLGGGLFMFWDRLFGTFEMPGPEPPKTGLTGNPKVRMNPWRVTFSGFAQIGYELKQNKGWKERWMILFGDVYYKPPVTKEYLICDQEQVLQR